MAKLNTTDYQAITKLLNKELNKYNYEVNSNVAGSKGSKDKNTREFRIRPINKERDTSTQVLDGLKKLIPKIKYKNLVPENVKYNAVSPNSSTFPSYSFVLGDEVMDIVVTKKTKGSGGFMFEDQIASDLNLYFADQGFSAMKHPDTVKEIVSELRLPQDELYQAKRNTGFKKRNMSFDPRAGLVVSNNTGQTIADVVIYKKGTPLHYLSLKVSDTFYAINAKVGNYFREDGSKKQINEYFGFDGRRMGAFGDEYVVETDPISYSKVDNNLRSILTQAYGKGLVVVHKKRANDNYVSDIKNFPSVSIQTLDQNSYSYPITGVRRYANIKVDASIDSVRYQVNFQFRGTVAGSNSPEYLRVLLKRL
jgi:hypothetical protein